MSRNLKLEPNDGYLSIETSSNSPNGILAPRKYGPYDQYLPIVDRE